MRLTTRKYIMAAIVSAALAACGSDDPNLKQSATPDTGPAEISAPQFDTAAAEAAMKAPMDGSSVEAFEKGMAELEKTVKPEDFRALQSALEWMLFYDFSVGGSKAKLYAKFDGKSPVEIISGSERLQD